MRGAIASSWLTAAHQSPGALARCRNHRREQDELRDLDAGRDERCCERPERLSDNDQRSAELTHSLDDGLGVVARCRVRIIERKPWREALMATRLEFGNRPAPSAWVDPGPGDEDERHLISADGDVHTGSRNDQIAAPARTVANAAASSDTVSGISKA